MIFLVIENEGASVNEPDEVDKHEQTREELRPCPCASSIVPKEMYDSATNVIFQEMKKMICGFIC